MIKSLSKAALLALDDITTLPRMNHHLSPAIREQLDKFDPSKEYSGRLPNITSASGRSYFVKTGGVDEQEQFTGEAESLKAIEAAAPGLAPRLYTHGIFEDGKPYFISEYKNIGALPTSTARELGKRLATELHRGTSPNGKFGFEVPTFCGPTRFENGWYDTWEECYSAMYGTLIARLREKGRYGRLCEIGDAVIERVIPKLLASLDIQPVILHGDLWSGNAGVDQETGKPVIFDPASFYGHNESDLGIARMFGGFPSSFFEAYQEHNPKSEPQNQYSYRCELYESFHYLNHTVIFGGSYAMQAEKKMTLLVQAESAGQF